jgi:hypothetical protein
MNATLLVSPLRAGEWARRTAIFWPAKGFPPGTLLLSFTTSLGKDKHGLEAKSRPR